MKVLNLLLVAMMLLVLAMGLGLKTHTQVAANENILTSSEEETVS